MKRNIKKMALAAMLAGMLGSLTGCFIQPDPTLDPLQISDGTVPFGTVQALPTNTPTPGAAEHAKPHAGHVAIQRPEHVGGLVERQSADNHAQNGGDCRAGRAKLADLHTGLQRGLPRAARRLDGQRRQRFAGAADRAGLLHRDDRRQILHRHAERRYGVPKPKRSHGGRHCGPRDAGQALFRVGRSPRQSAPARRKAAIRCSRRAHPVWRCANCRAVWRSWGIMRAAWMAFTARRRPAL